MHWNVSGRAKKQRSEKESGKNFSQGGDYISHGRLQKVLEIMHVITVFP